MITNYQSSSNPTGLARYVFFFSTMPREAIFRYPEEVLHQTWGVVDAPSLEDARRQAEAGVLAFLRADWWWPEEPTGRPFWEVQQMLRNMDSHVTLAVLPLASFSCGPAGTRDAMGQFPSG